VITRLPVVALVLLSVASAHAQSVRDHTRLAPEHRTTVTEAQAAELTLTVTSAAVQPLLIWVRTSGVIDAARRSLRAELPLADGSRIKAGQRVRAFSPESRARMYQGTVSDVVRGTAAVAFTVSLMGTALERTRYYVLEVVIDDGDVLSVPNEAIIETGGRTIVYVRENGGYVPRAVTPGVQGELFTQVLDGLKEGEQVVTIGSFFIDAEHKLKGP
jgi:hypothetical protein